MSKIINFEFYYLFIIVIFSRFITSTFMAGGTTVRLSRVGVLGYSLCNLTKRGRERERRQKLSVQVQLELQSFIGSSSWSCCCCLVYCYLLFHVANAFLLLPRWRCYYDYLFIYANAAVDADAARCLRMRTARVGRNTRRERERGNWHSRDLCA